MPTEVTTHIHEPQRKDFTIALRTVLTKVGEAIVIKEIDADKRLNANRPSFQPKLFYQSSLHSRVLLCIYQRMHLSLHFQNAIHFFILHEDLSVDIRKFAVGLILIFLWNYYYYYYYITMFANF